MRRSTIRASLYLAVIIVLIAFFSTLTFAHPGRTDSSGGHYVRTAGWGYPVGSYHYHNGGLPYVAPEPTHKYASPNPTHSYSEPDSTYAYFNPTPTRYTSMAMFLTDGAAEFDEIYKYKSLGELTGYSIGYQAGTEGNPKPSLLVQSSSQSTYYVQAYNESVKNGYLDGSKESQGGSSQSTDSSVAMIVGLLVLGIVIFVFFRDRAKK